MQFLKVFMQSLVQLCTEQLRPEPQSGPNGKTCPPPMPTPLRDPPPTPIYVPP